MKKFLLALAVLLLLSFFLSCSGRFGGSVGKVLIVLPGLEKDDVFAFHAVLYNRETHQSAVIMIPGEMILDNKVLAVSALEHPDAAADALGSLLGISFSSIIPLNREKTGALFAILDSLSGGAAAEEISLDELYKRRWKTLYAHSSILASEQVSGTLLKITGNYVPDKKVVEFLTNFRNGSNGSKEPYLISFPIDMKQKPLYDGAYGKELVRDILHVLNRKMQ